MEIVNEQIADPAAQGELTEPIQFKKGCMLNTLTAAQQEQLFDWAELLPNKTVLERVALPAPEGFGLKMHLTTLRRFHRAARVRLQKELTDSSNESSAETPASDPAVLDQITNARLFVSSRLKWPLYRIVTPLALRRSRAGSSACNRMLAVIVNSKYSKNVWNWKKRKPPWKKPNSNSTLRGQP